MLLQIQIQYLGDNHQLHAIPTFLEEFSTVLEQFASYNSQIIITGDLNLHLEDPTIPTVVDFQAITDQFGLTQHVNEPTHDKGVWLDVIIKRDDCSVTDLHIIISVRQPSLITVSSQPTSRFYTTH